MKDSTEIHVSTKVLREATMEQFVALRDNVLADGLWDDVGLLNIYSDFDTMMCDLYYLDPNRGSIKDRAMLIGIEKDGYTHS